VLKSGKKDWIRDWKQHFSSALAAAFSVDGETSLKAVPSRLEGGRSSHRGQGLACGMQLTPSKRHSELGVPA